MCAPAPIASRPACAAASLSLLAALAHAPARAQEPVENTDENRGLSQRYEHEVGPQWSHVGLLHTHDLTPFGLLRLDMLPTRSPDTNPGWSFEIDYAYQNTFVMSGNVRDYLENRNIGRQPLRTEDAAAILAMPDEAYYLDGEVGLADLIVQRRLGENWSAYFTVPYIQYGRGVLDTPIEDFHRTLGLEQQGRDLVARDRFQIVYDVGGIQRVQLDRETRGGFGDPVFGVRYSLPHPSFGWDVVVDLAAKIPVAGRRFLLSTGENDYGAQVTLQRRLGTGRQAVYLSGSAVRYSGDAETRGDSAQVIPTLIAGFSVGLTPQSSFIVQGYASRSVVQHSNIRELAANKYLVSAGLQGRHKSLQWSLAVTENIRNYENTPDVGVQFGLSYVL